MLTLMMKANQILFSLFCRRQQRFVFVSVFCCFLLGSCSPKMFTGLKSAEGRYSKGMLALFHPWQNESLVYKTMIKYKDKEFSSLTYLNALSDSVFKIILLSNFGNTLLEAEISRDRFTVNNVISYLDRIPILKLFEVDWRILLGGNLKRSIPKLFTENSKSTVFNFVDGRTNNLYHYDLVTKSVTMIESYKGKSKKVLVNIDSMQDLQPEVFSIDHPSLNLKITMSLLKRVTNETVE